MKTAIHIGSMRFYAHHGVLTQEQKVGNYFTVEATLYTDFSQALVSDELSDTVNYAEVYKTIADEMSPLQKKSHPFPATFAMCRLRSNGNLSRLSLYRNFIYTALMTPTFKRSIQKYIHHLPAQLIRNKSARHNQHIGIVVLACQ